MAAKKLLLLPFYTTAKRHWIKLDLAKIDVETPIYLPRCNLLGLIQPTDSTIRGNNQRVSSSVFKVMWIINIVDKFGPTPCPFHILQSLIQQNFRHIARQVKCAAWFSSCKGSGNKDVMRRFDEPWLRTIKMLMACSSAKTKSIAMTKVFCSR